MGVGGSRAVNAITVPALPPVVNGRRSLKILHFHESYPPGYGGGAAAYVHDVCQFLQARGHSNTVVCAHSTNSPEYAVREEHDGNVKVCRINLPYFVDSDPEGWSLGLRRWRVHQEKLVAAIENVVTAEKPDVALVHFPRPLGEDFAIGLARKGVPVVLMTHDAWALCQRYQLIESPGSHPCSGPGPAKCLLCVYSNFDKPWDAVLRLPIRFARWGPLRAYKLVQRWRLRSLVRGVLAYSQFMNERFGAFLPTRTWYVPLGIDLTGLPSERPSKPSGPIRFGFVAGFQPHKGLPDVLAGASELRSSGLHFELHIWGPLLAGRWQAIREMGLESVVHFHGEYELGDRWKVFSQMDILIMATRTQEPYGRVIGEARAMGVPSIAPQVGGITEQIRHGVDGLLFSFRNAGDLASQMRRVLEEPDLLPTMQRNQGPVMDTRDAVGVVEAHLLRLAKAASA